MSKNDPLRQAIFDKYAKNLDLLISEGILPDFHKEHEKTYVCPICLIQFSEHDLDQSVSNPLTLEHVPPDKLKGKPIVLTCETCNNSCGKEVDKHLIERMREMDKREFKPGAEIAALFKKGENTVRGLLKVLSDGVLKVFHSEKHNHPDELKSYFVAIDPDANDRIINMEVEPSKVDLWRLRIALLKIGYLMAFGKFGYAFILNPEYEIIRSQLRNPDKKIYPPDFFLQAPFPKEYFGVPFVIEKGIESIMPIFSLKTKLSERTFSTIIPLSSKPIEAVIKELKSRFDKERNIEVDMYNFDPTVNYLSDVTAIKHMLTWTNRVKN